MIESSHTCLTGFPFYVRYLGGFLLFLDIIQARSPGNETAMVFLSFSAVI